MTRAEIAQRSGAMFKRPKMVETRAASSRNAVRDGLAAHQTLSTHRPLESDPSRTCLLPLAPYAASVASTPLSGTLKSTTSPLSLKRPTSTHPTRPCARPLPSAPTPTTSTGPAAATRAASTANRASSNRETKICQNEPSNPPSAEEIVADAIVGGPKWDHTD